MIPYNEETQIQIKCFTTITNAIRVLREYNIVYSDIQLMCALGIAVIQNEEDWRDLDEEQADDV